MNCRAGCGTQLRTLNSVFSPLQLLVLTGSRVWPCTECWGLLCFVVGVSCNLASILLEMEVKYTF